MFALGREMDAVATQPFGELLRQLRAVAGLTQEELAERAGISVRGLSDIERGLIAYPRRDTAELIADGLQLNPDARAAFLATSRRPVRGATPTRPDSTAPANMPELPEASHPLLGREQELARASSLLLDGATRVLTVTGPGGVGKTRFAIELARQIGPDLTGRVWFVELAPLRHPEAVIPAIAERLGETIEAGASPERAIATALGEEPALIVLDNFEHVQAAAGPVGKLLTSCPALAVLVTSRSPLRLRAERELPLEPLPVDGGVALFVARARDIRPEFDPAGDELETVAEICRRLDGLPLAIELAAARTRQLRPGALLARLEQRLPLLTGGAIDLPERHQTLRDTIDWSYRLLDPDQQRLLRHLAVFTGGGALEQIAAVIGADDQSVLDGLLALTEQSLVRQPAAFGAGDQSARFTMLETIREFGREQLAERDELLAAERAHAAAMTDFVRIMEEGAGQPLTLARLDDERENVRAAYETAARDGDWTRALAIASGLWRYWEARGRLGEGRLMLERALEGAADAPAELRARAWNNLGNVANDLGDPAAAAHAYERSLELRRELGDRREIAATLNNLGLLATNRSDFTQATLLLNESLAIRMELGEQPRIALGLASLGNLALREERLDDARDLFSRALALQEQEGNLSGIAYGWWYLGEVERLAGRDTDARSWLERSLRLFQELDLRIGIANADTSLGALALAAEDYPAAVKHLGDALLLWREIGESRAGDCLAGAARIAAWRGRDEPALRFLASAAALRERVHAAVTATEQTSDAQLRAELEARLDAATAAVAWVIGRAAPIGSVLAEASQFLDDARS